MRPGGGRKPKAYTLLKRQMIAERGEEAFASFDLLVQIRDNPKESTGMRMAAANYILDRLLGRPKEGLLLKVEQQSRHRIEWDLSAVPIEALRILSGLREPGLIAEAGSDPISAAGSISLQFDSAEGREREPGDDGSNSPVVDGSSRILEESK